MKTLTCLFLSFLLLTGCSHHPQVNPNEFLIEGNISELPDSSIIQLFKFDGRLLTVAAWDTVIQGHFTLRDTLSTTTKYGLAGRGSHFPKTIAELWVAPGSYTRITGKGANFMTWKYDNDVFEQQQINAILDATRADWELLGGELVKVDVNYQYADSIQDQVIVKEMQMLNQMPVTSWWLDKLETYAQVLQYAPEHPVVPLLLQAVERMSEADKHTPVGQKIMSYVNLPKAVEIGDEMADGDLYDIHGKLHHLSELKGKYILLDFWSRGCGPCVASIPELEEISQLYASRLTVVSISEDGESSWKEFIREEKLKGLQWNQLGRSNPSLNHFYRINAIPGYVLISPEGKVIDKWCGYGKDSLKDKLKSLLP